MAKVNKNANIIAAHIAAEMPEMDHAAARVEREVKAEAAKHRDTGDFQRSIHTTRGRIDRIVYSDDPAAVPIERGHITKAGTDVPGKWIFTNTARRLGKKRDK